MQQKIILDIPTPCHENWNKMEPSTQNNLGRFCGSCQKNVVDFTGMSDAQVLAYFSTHTNNTTCGRFGNDQLNRVLATPPPPKKSWYKWIMAALISGFMFSSKAKAQIQGKVRALQTCPIKPPLIENNVALQGTLGGVMVVNPPHAPQKYILQGSVTDEKGMPIEWASVIIKGSKLGIVTDTDGRFTIHYNILNNEPTLIISSVGYIVAERKINLGSRKKITIPAITLKPSESMLYGEVVVGFTVKHSVKKTNKLVDSLQKNLPTIAVSTSNQLIIAPNPAKAGSAVNVALAKAGEYQLQLINLQPKIITTQKANIETDNSKISFTLPNSIAKGEYIITAINLKDKMQFSGKLIVQ